MIIQELGLCVADNESGSSLLPTSREKDKKTQAVECYSCQRLSSKFKTKTFKNEPDKSIELITYFSVETHDSYATRLKSWQHEN